MAHELETDKINGAVPKAHKGGSRAGIKTHEHTCLCFTQPCSVFQKRSMSYEKCFCSGVQKHCVHTFTHGNGEWDWGHASLSSNIKFKGLHTPLCKLLSIYLLCMQLFWISRSLILVLQASVTGILGFLLLSPSDLPL